MPDLPAPLTPPDCDLRDFQFMPLDVVRLRDSDMAATPNGEVFRAAVLAWCVSWHQVPAASLPDDDAILARLLGYGRDVKGWKKLRDSGALDGFVLCSDGRLYHGVVAEKALESWERKGSYQAFRDSQSEKGKKGAAKRWSKKKDGAGDSSGHPKDSHGHKPDDGLKGQGEEQGQGKDKPKAAVPAVVPEKPVQPKLLDEGVPNWVPAKPWAAFVEMRKAFRGAKFTEEAERLVLLELTKLRQAGHDPAAVLNQSIRKGWRDVFPIKSERQPNGASQSPRSFNHAIASAARRRAGGGLLDEGDSGDGRVIDGSCTEVPGSEDRRLGPPDHQGGM